MMLRFLIIGGLALAASSLSAAPSKLEFLTVGSKTYSNVTVLGNSATDIYFKHDQGIGSAKLKYLDPALQKEFHYDARAAAEAEQRQAQNDSLYAAANPAAGQRGAEPPRIANTSEDSLADPVSEKSLLGKMAPPLQVEKWLGDKPVLEGKSVLINFWAPWSIPCRKAIPELNALQKKFADKLVVVALASEPESEIMQMAGPKMEFASAIDTKAKLSEAIGLTSVPCVLLLDPKGIVRYQGHPAALDEKKLQSLLARVTAK